MKTLQLAVTAKNSLEFVESQLPLFTDNCLLVKSLYSGISHGSELATISGTLPSLFKKWNKRGRYFVDGKPAKKYPVALGYENVVEVLKVGSRVKNIKERDVLWVDNPHQTYSIVQPEKTPYLRIPDPSLAKKAIFTPLTRVALTGVHDAKPNLGDIAVVSGMGAVGLLVLQILKIAGVSKIFAVDPIELRRKKAAELGAITIDPLKQDVAVFLRDHLRRKAADFAIECSGSIRALHDSIRSCALGAKVVTVATYRTGANNLFLGEEWCRNRIELISSMSVNGCPHRDFPRWNLNRLNQTAFDLILDNKINTETLITHEIPFKEAPAAYELIRNHPEKTIKVVLSY